MQRQILHIYTYHDMYVFLSTIHIIFIYTLVYQYDDMSETTCTYIYIYILHGFLKMRDRQKHWFFIAMVKHGRICCKSSID